MGTPHHHTLATLPDRPIGYDLALAHLANPVLYSPLNLWRTLATHAGARTRRRCDPRCQTHHVLDHIYNPYLFILFLNTVREIPRSAAA